MPRVKQVLEAHTLYSDDQECQDPKEDPMHRLWCYRTPTLAHFGTLLRSMTTATLPNNPSLLVVDSLSSLLVASSAALYKEASSRRFGSVRNSNDQNQGLIPNIVAMLTSLAVVKRMAVVVTGGVVTKIRSESRASLRPAISGEEWENAMSARLSLFRDWVQPRDQEEVDGVERPSSARFAHPVKVNGSTTYANLTNVVPFTIREVCISPVFNFTQRPS